MCIRDRLGLLRNRSERRTSFQGCSRNPKGTGHDLQPWESPSEQGQGQRWRQAVGSSQEKPSSRSREENIATLVKPMLKGLPTALESKQPPDQQQAKNQALQPDQGSHLVLRQRQLPFDPEEDLLICKQESTDRLPSDKAITCLLYTSPSPRDGLLSRMPSSA